MTLETFLVGALVLVALLVQLGGLGGRGSGGARWAGRAVILLTAVAVAWLAWAYRPAGPSIVSNRPIQVSGKGYVSSDTCRACHPSQYASWHRSYHRTMTQVPGPQSIRGDFSDVTLELDGYRFLMHRGGEDFLVDVDPPAGSGQVPTQKRVELVTGSHHYQVYWSSTANGRELEQFPFAWLIEDEAWVSRLATVLRPSQAFLGIRPGGWNRSCIRCHATNGRPRLDASGVDTQVGEFGISCEACHGPGDDHVRVHRDPGVRYRTYFADVADPYLVQPERLLAARSVEVCGQCHGIHDVKSRYLHEQWLTQGYSYRPGDDLGETRQVVLYSDYLESQDLLERVGDPNRTYFERRFWADGEIRVVGREYNALLDTPCFQRGPMTCLSCHVLHPDNADPPALDAWANDQLKPGMRGTRACVQCHEKYAGAAAEKAHSHHPPATSGSDCYNCHMPHTTYGLLKAVRSHTITSPELISSIRVRRPNACNQCHLDQTLQWTAEKLEEWYEIPAPDLDERQREVAASLLWLLEGDAGQRALTAWSMGWPAAQEASGNDWIAPFLGELLDDPYDAVRLSARRSLGTLPGFSGFDQALLGDEAAREGAVAEVIERWLRSGKPSKPAPALLIDADGRLDESTLRELLRRRDDRVVWLTE